MITLPRVTLIAIAVGCAIGASPARAQTPSDTTSAPAVETPAPTEVPVPVDTTAAPPVTRPLAADTTTFAPRDSIANYELDPPKRDRDRFELGVAKVKGDDYDFLGTFAYHLFVRKNSVLEHWVHVELAAGKAQQITEIAVSGEYLFRPVKFTKRKWAIQPIFEFGPGFHLVSQIAEIEGFGDNAFHTHAYLKMHAFAGFDFPLSAHMGLVTRGRFTIPAHHPLDYAQIALFLR
ncbi:MAG TPA: hypothetical protein VGQ14_01320 [Candidatus Eisenbacteria bacterium]|nr:hypothetical protein [Candidatus Eisenbacteria bacterium]